MEQEPLIRTLIGEARQHPEEARQVISEAAKPMRERLAKYLRAAPNLGSVRRDLGGRAGGRLLSPGCCFPGMLRRTGALQYLDYAADDFVATCVELFLRGIAAPGRPKPHRR